MSRRRFAAALTAAAAVVLSAPYVQQLMTEAGNRWPGWLRPIGITATALPIAVAVLIAIPRIRTRRAPRLFALTASVAVTAGYITSSGLSFAESFHFVEYGVVAWLFYRAWRPAGDGSVLLGPLLAGLIVAALDEWFQWFIPIRAGELRDVALNEVATCCGLLFGVALDPPERSPFTLSPSAARQMGRLGAAAVLIVAGFLQSVHLAYEIVDGEGRRFRSRFSATALAAAGDERALRWRSRPPLVQARIAREDQYLSEGLWHVQRRNQKWATGDPWSAWHENRILEQFYAPVLDTPSHSSALGHRWPPEQRTDAASRAAAGGPYESDAQPVPLYTWPRSIFWGVQAVVVIGLLLLSGRPE